MNTQTRRWGWAFWYILLGLGAVLVGGAVGGVMGWLREKNLWVPEVALPILIITSLVALVAALAIASAILAALGLSDREHALGMPQGTVRAVIALGLLVIFSVSSMFLFNELEYTSTLRCLTQDQFDTLFKENAERIDYSEQERKQACETEEADEIFYRVRLRIEASEPKRNFANQMLTIVGTLVGTVSGFYFGSRALAVARGIGVPSLPVITGIDPKEGVAGKDVTVKVFGANLASVGSVGAVKLSQADQPDIVATKVQIVSDNQLECVFDLKGKAPGKWDLIVLDDAGKSDRLAEAFTVTAAPAAPAAPEVKKVNITDGSAATGKITVTIAGSGFADKAEIELRQESKNPIKAEAEGKKVEAQNITCTFKLKPEYAGGWELVVINPDGTGSKPVAFEVK